ncbi:hypothetical protein HIDPHFAB_04088 [Nocardioides sp. T2.26MG-1]|nr:hypothetical protein HIDPHFAB_04088 [Nocardioides sp. T2.26MG-1]
MVEEREPHGLVVDARKPDETSAVVEIVMTPDEWDDLVSITWGSVELAAHHVRELVLEQPSDRRYLVYDLYRLVPCDAPALPVDPGLLRLREIATQYPDGVIPGAGWYAHPPEDR